MGRIEYSNKVEGDNLARGRVNEAPISPKHAIEIARFVRGKSLAEAEAYLNDVVDLKKAIPFKKFNRNVAHKRGLVGWDGGRYPQKASLVYLRLFNSVRKNAEYSGLDTEKLRIIHVSANRGIRRRSFMPRAMGRATPKDRQTVNIEMIVSEQEA
ncbi:MAG TPA: 50S ribosomal protein L22 [Methanospirillum sp.]|jgi:large subunit ribosomal protein L22|uniref:50S ribosomal protein L22 n=1 Tax=Methanospirillum sp. TaxID=45200 RepID=UPI0029C7A383|nr:50S ribosomal protein L22 [Methanospirillum sp.]HWQ65206.1 50S ribosomal protein L22 [Methanospirillum sp.]